ncbi:MAG: dienelactone hydrolase family protein [Phycisphaerae bacterium]|nr:dienelactone hydrolase family protein [Phycisphaerae bacterium]
MKRLMTGIVVMCLSTLSVAAVKTETVEYKQGDTTLKGFLAYDDAGSAKGPGVLVVPEWWGLNDYVKGRAKQLADLGYVAFVADMYGDGKTTTDANKAKEWSGPFYSNRQLFRDRGMAALDQLKKQANVDASKLAAMGYCFGGTTALELARGGAPLLGVVTFHGGLSNPTPDDAKNIKGKVLVLTGADDPMIKAAERDAFEKEMNDAKVNYELDIYCGAKHAFTNPDADKFGIPGIAYNKQADQRSFARMKSFFDEIFGSRSTNRHE